MDGLNSEPEAIVERSPRQSELELGRYEKKSFCSVPMDLRSTDGRENAARSDVFVSSGFRRVFKGAVRQLNPCIIEVWFRST